MSAFIFLLIKLSPVDCWLLELYCANKSDITLRSIFLPKRLHGEASGCLSRPSVSGLTTPSRPQIIKTSQLFLTFQGYSFFREPSRSLWTYIEIRVYVPVSFSKPGSSSVDTGSYFPNATKK